MKYNPAKVTIGENKGRGGTFCQYVDEAPVHEINAESCAKTHHQQENNKICICELYSAFSSLTKSKPDR